MSRYIKIVLQVVIAFLVFSILRAYISDYILILILVSSVLVYILYKYKRSVNCMHYLEAECDVFKYLEFVDEKLKDKDQSKYLLYLSYGNLFNGDFNNIESNLNQIDTKKFKITERLMFEEIKLKLLYNNKDIEGYETKLEEIIKSDLNKTYNNFNTLQILRAPLLLLKEEFRELIDLMFEMIPKQRQSYRVMELEYYLSVAYVALGKDEDAIAVLELVTKRDFKLDHVVKGQILLDKLNLS